MEIVNKHSVNRAVTGEMSQSTLVTNWPISMSRHDGLVFIGLTLVAFSIAISYALREGITANSVIYYSGAISSIVIAVFAMRMGARHPDDDVKVINIASGIKDFILKRGILFVLVQAPIMTFFAGFFFRWTSYTVAVFMVLGSFMILPGWISYRQSVSDDPDEPVHHMALYLICACSAAAAFSLLRIVLHFMWGYIYWSPWFSFGSELSGLPSNTFGALGAGAMLYTMHGITLGMAYFILFKRHTLLNAILLLTFYLASLYSLLFPMLARFGQTTDWIFHATNWSAHFCVALGSWYSLKFWQKQSEKLAGPSRFALAALPIALAIIPVAFAFYRTAAWIEPTQFAIDEAVFNRTNLVSVKASDALRITGGDAGGIETRLQFALQIGPRAYANFNHKKKLLDAKQIKIVGKVFDGESVIAWCSDYIENLPSPNKIKSSNADYFSGIERMDVTEIPVSCVGSAQSLQSSIGETRKVAWSIDATWVGDWNQQRKKFSGVNQLQVASSATVQ